MLLTLYIYASSRYRVPSFFSSIALISVSRKSQTSASTDWSILFRESNLRSARCLEWNLQSARLPERRSVHCSRRRWASVSTYPSWPTSSERLYSARFQISPFLYQGPRFASTYPQLRSRISSGLGLWHLHNWQWSEKEFELRKIEEDRSYPVAKMITSAGNSDPFSNLILVFVKRSIGLSFFNFIFPSMISWLAPTSVLEVVNTSDYGKPGRYHT